VLSALLSLLVYATLKSFHQKQIDKDFWLTKHNKKKVAGAEWHFFRSKITGKVGASNPLILYLDNRYIDHKIYK